MLRGQRTHTSDNNPTNSHCRDNHDGKTFGMFRHISFRKLYTDSEQTSREDYAHDFEGDIIWFTSGCPWSRIEYTGEVGTHENSKCSA